MTDPVRAEQPSARDLFDLSGRAAVVTGGAGLLGVEFCRTLAQAGAGVLVADLNRAAAEALAERLRGEGLRAAAAGVDVTDPQSVEAMTLSAVSVFGRLDILVNSAALDPKFDPQALQSGSQSADFEHYPLELWNQALAVNLTGVFLCCQSAARAMLETPRSPQDSAAVVNLSSIYGITAPDQRLYQRPGQPPQYKPAYYTTTKFGVLGLTVYLAAYFAGKHLRVNAISPGGVYNQHDENFVAAYSAKTALGRMASRDDMNGALLYLCSAASAYVTGANLVVDGGWSIW